MRRLDHAHDEHLELQRHGVGESHRGGLGPPAGRINAAHLDAAVEDGERMSRQAPDVGRLPVPERPAKRPCATFIYGHRPHCSPSRSTAISTPWVGTTCFGRLTWPCTTGVVGSRSISAGCCRWTRLASAGEDLQRGARRRRQGGAPTAAVREGVRGGAGCSPTNGRKPILGDAGIGHRRNRDGDASFVARRLVRSHRRLAPAA
jgi:hypothetical protein